MYDKNSEIINAFIYGGRHCQKQLPTALEGFLRQKILLAQLYVELQKKQKKFTQIRGRLYSNTHMYTST